MKTKYGNCMDYLKGRAILLIRHSIWSLIVVFYSVNLLGQVTLQEKSVSSCCTRFTLTNTSTDSMFIVKYGLMPKYEDSCIVNASWIDSTSKTINIYASTTKDDFFEIEMPFWIYLYPNDSMSFNIKYCNYSNYKRFFAIILRPKQIKPKQKRGFKYSNRKVYKMKWEERSFLLPSN